MAVPTIFIDPKLWSSHKRVKARIHFFESFEIIVVEKFRDLNKEEVNNKKTTKQKMDLIVAGISLMVGLGFFAFIASILCSVAFFHHARAVVDHHQKIDQGRKKKISACTKGVVNESDLILWRPTIFIDRASRESCIIIIGSESLPLVSNSLSSSLGTWNLRASSSIIFANSSSEN